MAVQKTRKSRSRRGMRRAHQGLSGSAITTDPVTGERHRRHHMTAEGFYRGREVKSTVTEGEEE